MYINISIQAVAMIAMAVVGVVAIVRLNDKKGK